MVNIQEDINKLREFMLTENQSLIPGEEYAFVEFRIVTVWADISIAFGRVHPKMVRTMECISKNADALPMILFKFNEDAFALIERLFEISSFDEKLSRFWMLIKGGPEQFSGEKELRKSIFSVQYAERKRNPPPKENVCNRKYRHSEHAIGNLMKRFRGRNILKISSSKRSVK